MWQSRSPGAGEDEGRGAGSEDRGFTAHAAVFRRAALWWHVSPLKKACSRGGVVPVGFCGQASLSVEAEIRGSFAA